MLEPERRLGGNWRNIVISLIDPVAPGSQFLNECNGLVYNIYIPI